MANIEFALDGIGHQLQDHAFAVPIYQRSYAWDSDQIDDYCSDLRNAFGGTPREYFMGTVVVSLEGAGAREAIIDGQQRLATTAILFAAMRDCYKTAGEENRANHVQSTYLGLYDDAVDDYVPRLYLNADDNDFFCERILGGDADVTPSRESHALLLNAYEKLRDFVDSIKAGSGTNWVNALVEWRTFVTNDVRVIRVEVPNESDAFLIFETLNDRGADLTLADLLKNYLFGKAGQQHLSTVQNNWTAAQASLGNDATLFVTFIRHYWSSRHGAVRERDLYKSIKEGVASASQARAFSTELAKAAVLYAAIINSQHEYWNNWGTTTRNNIETLGRLGLEQNRPLLLAAMNKLTKAQTKRVLKALVNWSVRGLIVGGIGGGTTEKAYCEAAVKIRKGETTTANQLLAQISSIVPSDSEFEAAFAIARVTKGSLARYYLAALENGRVGTSEPELVPNSNEEQVNLEHVLPKKSTAAKWGAFTAEERVNYVDRIGNLALLAKSHNGAIGNEAFSVKKPILAASALELTKEVGAEATWTTAEINSRQALLAAEAVAVWKRLP